MSGSTAVDPLTPPPGNPRFPLLDGVRALAATTVLIAHAGAETGFNVANPLGAFTSRLTVGVAIFFVLSGFLLYRPFVKARLERRPGIRPLDFARRRILRIVPAYWLALTVLAIWPGLVGVFTGDWWRFYSFLQVYSVDTALAGLSPAWTLCVEMSFYLLLPLYSAAAARLFGRFEPRRSLPAETAFLLGLGTASAVLRVVAHAEDPSSLVPVTLAGTFLWFSLGMTLAVWSAALHDAPTRPWPVRLVERRPWAPWALAVTAFVATALWPEMPRDFFDSFTTRSFAAEHVLFGIVAVGVLLPAAFPQGPQSGPRRLLAFRPLALLGLISYGVYLWHQPLVREFNALGVTNWLPSALLSLSLASFAVAVACATLSYRFVERPALRLKERRLPPAEPPADRPAATG